jgi:hypothetical protein
MTKVSVDSSFIEQVSKDQTGTRSQLIAKLFEATEGQRQLDFEIAATFYVYGIFIPDYTTKIDAALTLIPKGVSWTIHSTNSVLVGDNQVNAATPAIALCIAALLLK